MSLKKDNGNYRNHKSHLHYGEYVAPHSQPTTRCFQRNKRRMKNEYFKRKKNPDDKKIFGITFIPFIY